MDFTSIGDTVNLAARLEGANKAYGTKTLITEAVHDKVQELYLCREIDLLTVKGKNQPVRIYELLQRTEEASAKLAEMKRVFEEGLAALPAPEVARGGEGLPPPGREAEGRDQRGVPAPHRAPEGQPARQGVGRGVQPDGEVGRRPRRRRPEARRPYPVVRSPAATPWMVSRSRL